MDTEINNRKNSNHLIDFGIEGLEHFKGNTEDEGEKSKRSLSSGHRSSAKSLHTPRVPTTMDEYEVLSTIGTGSYGTCQKIRRKRDGKVLVWKEMDYGSMTEAEKQMLVSEVNLLRELKSPYIVRYYDRIIDRGKTTIYIIMEYCRNGDLATLISRSKKEGSYVDEDFVWKILIQLTLALQECHQRKNGRAVLHRDLKPANVFLDSEKNVKLGDFGLARILHHENSFANTFVGTPYYMSPELVNNMSYNEKSDIWSMGCMLYELCALLPPFTASNQSELNRKIRMGDFRRIPLRYSDELNKVIGKMLQVEVTKRPSIEEFLKDPIVAAKQAKLERYKGGMNTSTDLRLWETELRALEKELEQKKKDLEERERKLLVSEKMFEDKEKHASLREKLADEKFARAESLLQEYERKSRLDTERLLRRDMDGVSFSDPSVDSLASCLTRAKKDPDTPKKKVSFDMYGKENLRHKDKYSDLGSKYDYDSYDSLYAQEIAKRRELKDRLFHAKARAMDLRGSSDIDTRPRSRNLLYFR